MSSLLSAELVATSNALGYYDAQQEKYYADGNTLETVKDLIRYLRRDDETFDIRRQLGETKVVQTDLLPLLKSYWQETDLFDVLLRLLVNLTSPALMLWQEEIPSERTARNHYLQIEEHLRLYKQAFADEAVWAVLSTRISKILELDPAERGDENGLIIERILILIRNILYVPADLDSEKRPDNDASIHDQVLWSLHQSGILDIILYMTSSVNEQAYYMHILEILSYMLREQSATELASAALQRSQTEKMRDEAELLAIRYRESNQKQRKTKMYVSTRHSRFGGTFVVKSMKSITDNELIYHKPLNKLDSMNFDEEKTKVKTPKNRLPVQSNTTERRSAFSIRLFLKEFCVEFLNGAYNTLMHHVKNRLSRARAQQHDESYYLWALRFFMEFNRCHKFEVKLVSETMSVQSFHYVQQQMEKYFDMMSTDRKKLILWSRRLHLALLAYRELLLTVAAMDKSPDSTIRSSSKVIKSNVFYVLEYRELILTLLITYDELKMSQLYLKDLLETQHVFLRMLESFCGGKESSVMVQAKNKARRKKKAAAQKSKPPPQLNLEGMWDEAAPQLSVVLEGNLGIPIDIVPFDATLDIPIDDQKGDAMKMIQRKLRNFEFEDAVGLLRASREVWPEGDCFGAQDTTAEDEFSSLKDVFFADLGENDIPQKHQNDAPQEDEYEEDEDDELEQSLQISESDLKFMDFARRLAHPRIVRACGLALANFDKNSALTNHCIAKLLHRIAVDCKMPGMVFQVSIFMTFQKIYEADNCPQYEELVKFSTFIIRQFFKVAQKNDSVYMEALFWKSSRDAFEIEEGYGTYREKSAAAAKAWTELEEDELRRLFMEHTDKRLQEDVIDWIVNNIIDNTRTRRGVLKKLKEMYLLTDYKGRKQQGVSGRPSKQWGAEEEAQLRELYEQFKDAMDPLTCIMERLEVHRPKNRIIEKLLVMGLVQDRKELRKKRTKKSGPNNNGSESESSDASDHNISAPISSNNSKLKPPKQKQVKPRNTRTRKPMKMQVSSEELAKILIDLVNTGEADALEWIMESFQDAADDLENDPSDDEKIPLVPILDCAVSAMENHNFLKLLRALGIQEPSDEQETYWRIPPSLTSTTLKNHSELIKQALDGTLTISEEPIAEETNEIPADSGSEDDVFDSLRKFTNKNVPPSEIIESGNSTNNETEDTIESVKNVNSPTKKHSTLKKILKIENFKSLKKTKTNVELIVTPEKAKPAKTKKRIRVSDSTDDEEEDVERIPEDNVDEFAVFKPARIASDSEEEPSTQTVRNVLDSDSDDETTFKNMKVIPDSDDEEDVGFGGDEGISLKKKNTVFDSEEEEDESNMNEDKHNKKKTAVFDSEEEDKENMNTENEDKKRARSIHSGSDNEKPDVKRSRIIDSDED